MEIDNPGSLAVACFLLKQGASLDARNQRHVTPVMHIIDSRVIDVARNYAWFVLYTVVHSYSSLLFHLYCACCYI